MLCWISREKAEVEKKRHLAFARVPKSEPNIRRARFCAVPSISRAGGRLPALKTSFAALKPGTCHAVNTTHVR